MTLIYLRINQIITHYGITLNAFCLKLGLKSTATISKIIHEKRNPSAKTLGRIIHAYPDINYDWLVNGQGDMLKSDKEASVAVNEDDLTVTSKQIINFIKNDVIDYINKQIGINQGEFLNQIENVGQKLHNKFLPDIQNIQTEMIKTAQYYLENKFNVIDNRINDIQKESTKNSNYYKSQHFTNGEKIDNLGHKLNDVIDNVEKLNVLIQQIETQDVINKDRIANFIEPKKKK